MQQDKFEQLLKDIKSQKICWELNLKNQDITDEQVIAIVKALKENPTITALALRDNRIGDAGAIALAGNNTITTLDLGYNNIGDAGATALAGNRTVTTLYLDDNNIGNAGAMALAGNRTITILDLGLNNIGDAELAHIREAIARNRQIWSLHYAAAQDYTEALRSLTKAASTALSEEINKRDGSGNTPLHIACANGRTANVHALLKSKVIHLNQCTRYSRQQDGKLLLEGKTPLLLAVEQGFWKITMMLLQDPRLSPIVIEHCYTRTKNSSVANPCVQAIRIVALSRIFKDDKAIGAEVLHPGFVLYREIQPYLISYRNLIDRRVEQQVEQLIGIGSNPCIKLMY